MTHHEMSCRSAESVLRHAEVADKSTKGLQGYNCSFLRLLTSVLASACRLNGQQRAT
jgi:hypothetical protein